METEAPKFKKDDYVTIIRDFPRLGILAVQKMAAHVEIDLGNETYEISWYDEKSRKRTGVVVLSDWIEHRKIEDCQSAC